MKLSATTKQLLILGAICVLTFICFSYTRHNQFTNWDDDWYVTNDPYIKGLTKENLKVIFTQDITKNNYHPLCMLSLALNYHFAQMNPMPYYVTNIVIHIFNVMIVFFLLLQLCRRLKMDETATLVIAGLASLWFGVHPMRVESVSWIAERKDVLYAFFYFCGMATYIRYLDDRKIVWYIATFVLFVLSCLSKPMAVVFPMSLLCIDVLLKRQLDKKLVIEKVLFFATALIFGGAAFYTQNKTGAVASFSTLTIAERVMYAAYGFIMYISKLFNPTHLSSFYPYPYRYINGNLPTIYYMAPILAIAFITVPLLFTRKRYPEYFRILAFGIGYFVVNVMFVLQFISVGAAIMSDRYSYVSYFGLFFILAYFINEIRVRYPAFRTGLLVILLCTSGGLAYGCYQRTLVWHDSETLHTDAIEKYPMQALLSYKWLGNYYFHKGDYDKALENFNVLTMLHAEDEYVKQKLAIMYNVKQSGGTAMMPPMEEMSGQAPVSQGSKDYMVNVNKSLELLAKGDSLGAFRAYIMAIKENPLAEKALSDGAFNLVQQKQYDAAIPQYNMLIKLNTSNPFFYFYRGVAYFSKGMTAPAMVDWEIAVKHDVKDIRQSAGYNLSVAYDALDKDSIAVYYAEMALAAGYNVAPDFMKKLKDKKEEQRRKKK